MMAISANSDKPEACMKFLNLLNTDPIVMTLLNYGVEDIHYNLNDQGEAEFTDARANSYTVWTNGLGDVTLLPPMWTLRSPRCSRRWTMPACRRSWMKPTTSSRRSFPASECIPDFVPSSDRVNRKV